MKGLLLQDIYLMKKNLQIVGGICIVFFFVFIIGSGGPDSSGIDIFIYGLCGIIPCFLTSCACFIMNNNRDSKTAMYIETYPLKDSVITLEKYVITYGLLFCSYIIISIFVLVNHFVNHYTPGKNMLYICFLIFSAIFLFLNIQLPVILRFGQAIASGILIAVLCLGIIIGLVSFIKIAESPSLYRNLSAFFGNKLYIVLSAILIDILSMTGSFYLARALCRL